MSLSLVVPGAPPAPPALARQFERLTDVGLRGVRESLDALIAMREQVQPTLFGMMEAPAAEPDDRHVAPVAAMPQSETAYCLSPSQVNCFVHDCQAKWHYRSNLHLPEPSDTNRVLGSAVHAALGENFRQKIETKTDLDTLAVRGIFRDALAKGLESLDGERNPDEVNELVEMGATLCTVYMEQAAPAIEPAAVELRVTGEIGGVPVQGYIDVMDVEGNIIDIKTAKKKPSGLRPDYRLQVATYAMLCPQASGRTRLETITKTKTVQLHQQTIDVTDADRRQAEVLYPLAQESMRSGLYLPNRSSFLCSRKYCAFASRCEADYGGEVEE